MDRPPDRDHPAYDHKLVEALEHPIRAALLGLMAKRGPLSAAEALPLIDGDADLEKVVYQVRTLADAAFIEPTGDNDPGGGLRFQLTESGRQATAALGLAPE